MSSRGAFFGRIDYPRFQKKNIGVLSRDRVVSGGRGAEFPESPALGPEVIAGPQPGALGFRADAPDVSGAGGRPTQAMEALHEDGSFTFGAALAEDAD